MDPTTAHFVAAADLEPLASPTLGKRSVELKRRSFEPAEAACPTSAPKLHCTFSAKLVDLMSNFSVAADDADAEAAAAASDCSGATAADEADGAAPALDVAGAEEDDCKAVAADAKRADDACSAASEQAALSTVPEEAAAMTDDEASGPKGEEADALAAARAAGGVVAPPTPPLPAADAARGAALAAVFERFQARAIATPAPADVAAAVRAHLASAADAADAAAAAPASGDAAAGGLAMDTMYFYDLAQVARMHAAWVAALPRVVPYYAVKCNPEPALLAALEALGCGFDCASQAELSQVVGRMGVSPGRVIFANPCKRPADIALARRLGVARTTFDTECELLKIAAAYPSAGCVLRLRCDDAGAQVQLGLKYGAEPHEVPGLLAAAKRLGLNVVGVSFHVGSGVRNYETYFEAVRRARAAFDAAAAMGFADMTLLDVGGGFVAPFAPGPAAAFAASAAAIARALEAFFPAAEWPRLEVISEPGRYFAESAATLVAPVYSVRLRTAEGAAPGEVARRDYW